MIEHLQQLLPSSAAYQLLIDHFLPFLSDDCSCILVSHTPVQVSRTLVSAFQYSPRDLKLDDQIAVTLAKMICPNLPAADIRQINTIAQGRPSLLLETMETCSSLEPDLIHRSVKQARTVPDLLKRFALTWMMSAAQEDIQSMLLDVYQEYIPSPGLKSEPDNTTHPLSGWKQVLNQDWSRVHCAWRNPLKSVLESKVSLPSGRLRQAAESLITLGEVDLAIPLFFETGDLSRVAEILADQAQSKLDLGQWESLSATLNRLPEWVIHDWPWLVYAKGEIATARRDIDTARPIFSVATNLFRDQHDSQGICLSLLTESTIAYRSGEKAIALNHVLGAQIEARNSRLPIYEAYAYWQLGCLYADQQLFESAAAYFEQAQTFANQASNPAMAQLAQEAVSLVRSQKDLHQQKEQYRQTLAIVEQAEQEAAAHIQNLLNSAASNLEQHLSDRGWSRTPLHLKIAASPPQPVISPQQKQASLWQGLMDIFGFGQATQDTVNRIAPVNSSLLISPPLPLQIPEAIVPTGDSGSIPPPAVQPTSKFQSTTDVQAINPRSTAGSVGHEREPAQTEKTPGQPTIAAYLLDTFHVAINNQPITNWSSGRGRAVFQYLLATHHRPRTRDMLMDIFWQDASPEAARNSLNVALHGLRQNLRSINTLPIILFLDTSYLINPEFSVWLDVDEFEYHTQLGIKAEQAGDYAETIKHCEMAIQLYKDDFLADEPYEEWTILPRERLRMTYLDTLDRLSRIYLKREQYPLSAMLCQRILERDRCREDAHCRLMRCYAGMGEFHLAVRQYQTCVEALRADLDIGPSPATIELFEKLNRREPL